MQFLVTHPKRGMSVIWTADSKVTWATPAHWWAVGKSWEYTLDWLKDHGFKATCKGLKCYPTPRFRQVFLATAAALVQAEIRIERMNTETYEYSVCEDCLLYLANDDVPEDKDHEFYADKVTCELNGRTGHFSVGVEQTEDDPEGRGEEEFSSHDCELCRSGLAGSRYGVTLFIQLPDQGEQHAADPD